MAFFDDDDPFESIMREFMGGSRRKHPEPSEAEERTEDIIETPKKLYLIFEIPGYNKKDVIISVSNNQIQIQARKSQKEAIQPYLNQKFSQGLSITKTIPKKINTKNFTYTVKNGILEITLNKK